MACGPDWIEQFAIGWQLTAGIAEWQPAGVVQWSIVGFGHALGGFLQIGSALSNWSMTFAVK